MATRRQMQKRRAARRRRKRIILVVEVFVLLILIGVLYVVVKMDKIQWNKISDKDIQTNDIDLDKVEKYTTIALFGVDSRDGSLDKGSLTDAIMIGCIDNDSGEIKLVSVYRDTLLHQADEKETYNKANAAYAKGGPEQAINMLNKNLDLFITDYVTVDFRALSNTINALGGIEVEMTAEEVFWTNGYVTETKKVTEIETEYLPEGQDGTFLLDGVQATSFCRIRYTAGDDFRRTERQRLVLEKMFEKAKQAGLGTLNKIVDEVFPQIATSLSSGEIIKLGTGALKYTLSEQTGFPFHVETKVLDGSRGDCVIPQGLAANVEKLHKFLYENEEYDVSPQLKIINDKIIEETGIKEYVEDTDDDI